MGKERNKFNRAKRYHETRRRKRKLQKQGPQKRIAYDSTRYSRNSLFEEYYKAQKICGCTNEAEEEEDFRKLLEAFGRPLPATLRVYSNGMYYKKITEFLEKLHERYTAQPVKLDSPLPQFEGVVEEFTGPKKIEWYPGGSAWRVGTNRVRLRKEKSLEEFHQFLVREAKTENITRQEEVSMIPPLLLDIQPHHRVFDACASPGSKTAQLLEFLHGDSEKEASGFVVANDADPRRAYMLHHQLKRFCSPNLLITCAEAQLFPELKSLNTNKDFMNSQGIFDRILCDVPCSGDGTLRKNVDVWRTWDCNNGLSLHPLQVMILWKAVKLLKIDGYVAYSTCSLNPIENEAVIAQVVRMAKGALEIVDCSDRLKGLKRRKGLNSWKLAVQIQEVGGEAEENKAGKMEKEDGALSNRTLRFFDSIQDFVTFRNQHPVRRGKLRFPKRLCDSMFSDNQKDLEKLGVQKCLRIYPQDQDTGGFFVCLLLKTKSIGKWNGPITSKTETENVVSENPDAVEKRKAKQTAVESGKAKFEKDPQMKQVSEAIWNEMCEEFGIESLDIRNQLYFRPPRVNAKKKTQVSETKVEVKGVSNGAAASEKPEKSQCAKKENPKVISFVCPSLVETFLQKLAQDRLNIISCGLPIFRRSERSKKEKAFDDYFKYRLTNDGLNITTKLIRKRILRVSFVDVALFCRYAIYEPKDEKAKEGKIFCPGVPMEKLSLTLRAQLDEHSDDTSQEIKTGSYVLMLEAEDAEKFRKVFGRDFMIAVWKAKKSLSQLIAQAELRMLYSQMERTGLLPKELVEDAKIESYFLSMHEIKVRLRQQSSKN